MRPTVAALVIPALGVNEPYASAIVHGLKRRETRGQPPNGEMRPDGVTGFPGVRLPRGGRIMVIANGRKPRGGKYGPWDVIHARNGRRTVTTCIDASSINTADFIVDLHPGHIVGSVVVEDVVPIVGQLRDVPGGSFVLRAGATLELWTLNDDRAFTQTDISDQLPWGDWQPGRWAWQLAAPKSTTEMCPMCEGTGDWDDHSAPDLVDPDLRTPCEFCHGDGWCDPIPVRGRQGLWEFTAEALR